MAESSIDAAERRRDRAWAAALAAACFAVFLASPIEQVGDSHYTLMLADQLLRERSFDLGPRLSRGAHPVVGPGLELPYQLERFGPHVYYDFSPANAVFSVPFVPLLRLAGLSFVPPDGGYDPHAERRGQRLLAALLSAATVAAFFAIARTVAARGLALAVALAGGLGTQVWSTASRGLWSHTWALLFVSLGLLLLVRALAGAWAWRPAAIACLFSAAYLARPTFAIPLAGVGALLLWHAPRRFLPYALTAGAWVGVVVAYSRSLFGTWLPGYFAPRYLSADQAPLAFLGTWLSPARGFALYVPLVAFLAYAAIRYPPRPELRPLRLLAAAVIVGHSALVASNPLWWGGHCYGPRYMTDVVPWAVLLGVLAIDGRTRAADGIAWTPVERATAGLLAALGIVIHARGALDVTTHDWNERPYSVDAKPERLWDWRRPQMLAGWFEVVPPGSRPLAAGQSLDLRVPENDRYLGEGWSLAEEMQRWALSPAAELAFEPASGGDALLRVEAEPFLLPGRLPERPAEIDLNGRTVGRWRLRYTGPRTYTVRLPRALRAPLDRVRFRFPGRAPTQLELGLGDDGRPLALAVHRVRLEPLPPLARGQSLSFAGRDADAFLGAGWSEPEALLRWTEEPEAEVWFSAAETGPALLRLGLNAFIAPGLRDRQRLRVELNGWTVTELELTDAAPRVITAVLPPGALAKDNVLRLHLPDAAAGPADPKVDPRPLGIAVRSLAIEELPAYAAGGIQPQSPDADRFLVDGWAWEDGSKPSPRWTAAPRARLAFALEATGGRVMRLDLAPFLAPDLPRQRVDLALNGARLASLELNDEAGDDYPLALPPGALGRYNVLSLDLPDARSPRELGLGDDPRRLGVVVRSLRIE